MALVGVEREPLVSEPDALTTRPPPYKGDATADTATVLFIYFLLLSSCIALMRSDRSKQMRCLQLYYCRYFRAAFLNRG